ncbi:hypothetical protein FNV43_RR12631 [Rhamnella rubrinervis]|uniref:Auxin-responsive protein n=1 Tax=Rhamnella rubrinervis TaxID=2594499 RepID=A0A8K0H828_9ROSA|nr:hypothetical protein FNV43_RR12631 [Rhamnella rubrinervis]
MGEEEDESNVTLLASWASLESVELKEHNYMGLSGSTSSSVESSVVPSEADESTRSLILKSTELRLGLPGSQSPERDPKSRPSSNQLNGKPLFPLHSSNDVHYAPTHKAVVSGNKRGFSDAMDSLSEEKCISNAEVNMMLSPRPSPSLVLRTASALDNTGTQPAKVAEVTPPKMAQERPRAANETKSTQNGSENNNIRESAPKAQVAGWPPIRSSRKNSLAAKNSNELDGKVGPGALFVKVSMDGAPYLRKVDLKIYSAYQELSSALEMMFSCFTIGQCRAHGALGKEILCESKLKDLLHGSENVVTYEDKVGDWMLVGDIPWEMFINTCRRLRIMKSCDAIGLGKQVIQFTF